MTVKKINYSHKGKKYSTKAKVCNSFWSKGWGLMFRRRSPPLFFVFKREKSLPIHSFFCKPFKAIWLDENMKTTQVLDVKTWKTHIPGRGKYLLEVPLSSKTTQK